MVVSVNGWHSGVSFTIFATFHMFESFHNKKLEGKPVMKKLGKQNSVQFSHWTHQLSSYSSLGKSMISSPTKPMYSGGG